MTVRLNRYREAPGAQPPARAAQTRDMLWRRLDHPGHEIARLTRHPDGTVQLRGTAIFDHDGQPTIVEYDVECDATWRTLRTHVLGRRGARSFDLRLTADSAGRWTRDAEPLPRLDGCIDVDLGFTPSTNLLPIRRLMLPVGSAAPVRAAWVRFPELSVEVLEQVYRRTASDRYIYESNGGTFRAELTVDDTGFVTNYPNLWTAEGASR